MQRQGRRSPSLTGYSGAHAKHLDSAYGKHLAYTIYYNLDASKFLCPSIYSTLDMLHMYPLFMQI